MRLIRLYTAIALLRGAEIVAGVVAAPHLTGNMAGEKPPLHPVERLLLASLVGIAICAVWILMTWRALG